MYICMVMLSDFNYIVTKLESFSMNTYIHIYTGVMNLRSIATNTALIITWNPTFDASKCGPVLYYTVTATSLADDNDRNTIVVWGTRAELSDLMNGINYTISVAAVNRAGTGPSSMITLSGNEGIMFMNNSYKYVRMCLLCLYVYVDISYG